MFHSRNEADASELPTPRNRPGVWRLALWMTVVILGLLLFNERQYVFGTKLYESSDWASNSLFVREAEHGLLLHGHYSRWDFYHPGPALLDTLAVGEALFYHGLHLVPTPYNGQVIALGFVLTLFFSLALSIFAGRLGPARGGYRFFLPLALLFAVWHYGNVHGGSVFMVSWPACPPILVFLCFLVAVASTASGSGWELPVVAAAGGWLVHNHVAQPLFVVPLTLLAYAGLLASCRQPLASAGNTDQGDGGGLLTRGWRAFPRAHWAALAVLALFVLPLALDALHGSHSNLSRILTHLRTHHDPGKKFLRSVCYFLTFATYGSYEPGQPEFRRYSAAGMLAFARLHWQVYSLWAAALLAAPALFFVAARRMKTQGKVSGGQDRRDFVPWFYATLAAALGLTLVWGMKQDGPMFYFNAFFNYSIYFGVALGFVAALAAALMVWTDSPVARKVRPVISALLWIGVAGAVVHERDSFRLGAFGTAEDQAMARTVEQAAAALPKDAVCFLDFHPPDAWPVALGVALELQRLGHPFRVDASHEVMFGSKNVFQRDAQDDTISLTRWAVVPVSETPANPARRPLMIGFALETKEPASLDPAGGRITFSGDGNFNDYALFGWGPTHTTWTWSTERSGLLEFRPLPLPESAVEGVDVLLSAWAFVGSDKPEQDRLVLQFNGKTIGTVLLLPDGAGRPPLRVRISAAQWRDAVAKGVARLRLQFPDARSPASYGLGADDRPLGGGFSSIEFQLAHNAATEPVSQ